jgi:hypothetical protein
MPDESEPAAYDMNVTAAIGRQMARKLALGTTIFVAT